MYAADVTRFHVSQPSHVSATTDCRRHAAPRRELPATASTAVVACATPTSVVVTANAVHERHGNTSAAQPHSVAATTQGSASQRRGRRDSVIALTAALLRSL